MCVFALGACDAEGDEEEIVKARLLEHGGNVTEAAKSLGMTRVGLLKRHGIDASALR